MSVLNPSMLILMTYVSPVVSVKLLCLLEGLLSYDIGKIAVIDHKEKVFDTFRQVMKCFDKYENTVGTICDILDGICDEIGYDMLLGIICIISHV